MRLTRIFICLFLDLILCSPLKAQTEIFPDSEDLIKMKQSQGKDNVYGHLFSYYIKYANASLKSPLYSVMQKNHIPASGNKHDYMSFSIYYWPNPSTENGLPYIRKDGITNPEYKEFDLPHFNTTTFNLKFLAIGAYLTGNHKYSDYAVKALKKWFLDDSTKMNPNFNYAQIVPGINRNVGNVYGVIEAKNFNSIIQSIELLKECNSFSETDFIAMKRWFEQFLNWCLTSNYGKEAFTLKNNIGTAYDVTVTRIALFTGYSEVANNIIQQFKKKRIEKQIADDGSQPQELTRANSFGYSMANLNYLLEMIRLAKVYNIDIGFAKVNKALKWLNYNYQNRNKYEFKQINGWQGISKELASLYWSASKCGYKKYYIKLYKKYKEISIIK